MNLHSQTAPPQASPQEFLNLCSSSLVLGPLPGSMRCRPRHACISQKRCKCVPGVFASLSVNAGPMGATHNDTKNGSSVLVDNALVSFPGDVRYTGGSAQCHLELSQTSLDNSHSPAQNSKQFSAPPHCYLLSANQNRAE